MTCDNVMNHAYSAYGSMPDLPGRCVKNTSVAEQAIPTGLWVATLAVLVVALLVGIALKIRRDW